MYYFVNYLALKEILNNFIHYDVLTQLTLLETIENHVKTEKVFQILSEHFDPIKLIGEGNVNSNVLRKIMYVYSKLYAKECISDEKYLKNIIAISSQYFEENTDYHFFLTILHNLFINKNFINFLSNEENSKEFNFLETVNKTLIDGYFSNDPVNKINAMEIFAIILDYTSAPSIQQRIYFFSVLDEFYNYLNNKKTEDKDELFKIFVDQLYKDFKVHDHEEYELKFLELIFQGVPNTLFTKWVCMNFDLLLYILNKRLRIPDIMNLKYQIVKKIYSLYGENLDDSIKIRMKTLLDQDPLVL